MEKFNRWSIKFALWFTPVVVVEAILAAQGISSGPSQLSLKYVLFELAGWTTVLWGALVIYLFFAVALNEKVRDSFVRRLAGMKENDEREALITGLVSKRTFISMTGILVLLLFLSTLHVQIYKYPDSKVMEGSHGAIEFGLGMSVLAPDANEPKKTVDDRIYFFKFMGLPLSADGTLLLILVLQMTAFYYFSRKENRVNDSGIAG